MVLGKLIALCFASAACLAFPICSLFTGWRIADGAFSFVGYAIFGLGAAASCLNFYLSFVRYPLFVLRGKPPAEFKYVSGAPFLGMLAIPGLALAPPSIHLSLTSIALALVDSGNLLWFVLAVWKDDSFWQAAASSSWRRCPIRRRPRR